MNPELRKKNIRTAWLLVGFALFILFTSVPFWKGFFQLAISGNQ